MTSSDSEQAGLPGRIALAHDALQMVSRCPEHAPAWWRLIERLKSLPQAHLAGMAPLVDQLEAGTAQAVWLKHSALWRLSGDAAHLACMARVAPQLPDPDRWMALAILVWDHALTRAHDRAAFRQLFVDARQAELLGMLGQGLPRAKQPGHPGATRNGLQRVAIVVPHLSVALHAGTSLAFDLRAALEGMGVGTHVFAAQELALPTMSSYFAGRDDSLVTPARPSTWRLRTPGAAQVTLANAEFSLGNRWSDLLHGIARHDPDVVLFVGFSSPLVWALQPDYPVVGMSLHTVPPLAPVDVWLAADPRAREEIFWPGLPAPQVTHFPYRFWPAQPAGAAARDTLGVPRDAVLLASSGYRLLTETPPAWMQQLLGFLDEHPRVHWLLVGVAAELHDAVTARHPRLHCLPHQDDLAGCLRMADIYLNPPRMGGGASVALAMDLGLPVLSLRGSDGGDKVGSMAVDDTNGYMQRLAEWAADAELRRQAGAELQRRFRDELDISRPEASQRLIQACHQAIACFERRHGGPHAQTHLAE